MTSTFRKKVELKRIEMQKQIDALQISCKNKNSTIENLRSRIGDVKLELRKEKKKDRKAIPEQAKKKITCLKNEVKVLNKKLNDAKGSENDE